MEKVIDLKPTELYFDEITGECLALMEKKHADYGDSWKIMRPSSLTDQIAIKAMRIRSIQEKQDNKVGDSIDDEFRGILNYSLIALHQLYEKDKQNKSFVEIISDTKKLLGNKNHDYGEAWRHMRISSITDLILMKLLRVKQIEENDYVVKNSEKAQASFHDIVNYCVFALIHISEGVSPMK